jgi:hypothetical protein
MTDSFYNPNTLLDDIYIPIRKALEPPQWRPIEDYPKDGSRVLLYFPDYNDPIQIGYCSDEEWSYWRGSWPHPYFLKNRPSPTHWMVLPTQPTQV